MAASASASSSGSASTSSNGRKKKGRGNKSRAATAARKNLGFVGTRRRQGGRWAAELRAPGTRGRLWIGTFGTPEEAAHAYDAAIFCFYGDRDPTGTRKINYPAAPRPNIPENVRVGLSVANIKAIAVMHAQSLAGRFFIPPPPAELPAAAAAAAPEEVVEPAPPAELPAAEAAAAPEEVVEPAPAPEVVVAAAPPAAEVLVEEAVPVPAVGASIGAVDAAPTMQDDFVDFDYEDFDRVMALFASADE